MINRYSKLLIDEPPLQIQAGLAVVLGLNEAIVVQQIHYWMPKATKIVDDRPWVYNTVSGWKSQFPFWSENTIARTLKTLRESGILDAKELSDSRHDRTLYYSINYEALEEAEQKASLQKRDLDSTKMVDSEPTKMSVSYTETTQRIQTPVVPRGDEGDFSEVEEIADEGQAPSVVGYPAIVLVKEKTPRIAADHPTFSQDWERIWSRYSEIKPSTPKAQTLARAKKLTLAQWDTFKETFPSWVEEWERRETKYIPHLTTHLKEARYTEPFRAGKGIVPASTQKARLGPPEGFSPPLPNEPGRISTYASRGMEILRDLGVVTKEESFEYLETAGHVEGKIAMGQQAKTEDYEYVIAMDERVRVWLDEKGGRAIVKEYQAKKKAEQRDSDDEEYD